MMKHDKLLDVLHSTAAGLHQAGVMDLTTLREFDALCLPPVQDYSAAQIKGIRLRFKASQAVFAAYLNTSPSTIQQWERGQKHPNGMALKLLSLVDSKGLQALA
jgi:putative transcriptional regulator